MCTARAAILTKHRFSWQRPGLSSGPVMVTLLLFSLPVLGASVLQSLNSSINGAWVGHLIGEVGVAATANANLIIFLITALIFGFGTAATIMIGRSMGAEDLIGARKALGSGLTLFLALGLLASL